MKRTFISLFLIVILTITMTACKSKNSDVITSQAGSKAKDNNIVSSSKGSSTDNSTNKSTNSATSSSSDNSAKSSVDIPSKTSPSVEENKSDEEEIFYGEWSINKQTAYGPVGIYSNDDIRKMIGKKLSYSKEKAVYDTDNCENPAYKKETISGADFETSNKVKLSALGITDSSVVQITVYTDNGYKSLWNGNGCTFYIKDSNTLILFDGGVYLELDRVTK